MSRTDQERKNESNPLHLVVSLSQKSFLSHSRTNRTTSIVFDLSNALDDDENADDDDHNEEDEYES
jgi:hypothetical protein